MKEPEQRETPRYRGALPLVTECGCKGVTRDLSSSGIFFETDCSLSPGQSIEFSIVMEHVDPNRPVCLKCKGVIVRLEKNGQRMGVAVTIDSYSIIDHDSYYGAGRNVYAAS